MSGNLYGGVWTPTGSLNDPRQYFQMLRLPSGSVLAAGGRNGTAPLASAEIYSPSTAQWTPTGSLITARYYHQMVLLPNGNVLAAGGLSPGGFQASCEIYSPSTAQWTPTGSLITAHSNFQLVLLQNGNFWRLAGFLAHPEFPPPPLRFTILPRALGRRRAALVLAGCLFRWCCSRTAMFCWLAVRTVLPSVV